MDRLRRAFFDRAGSVRTMFFSETGILASGMKADLAVMDYTPITPISRDNLLAHLVFGMKSARAYMTICDGTILQKDGKLLILKEEEIGREARKVVARLHEKYYD